MWKIDVYPSKRRNVGRYLNRRFADVKESRNGYWIVETNDIRKAERILSRKGIRYKKYRKEWDRSSDYRKKFLSVYPGPFRCVYCNRIVQTENMQVDHLIPVNKIKTSSSARLLLKMCHIDNVNDIKNLVPSCAKCNLRKADKMGLWFWRGKLGKYKTYWFFVWCLRIIAIIAVIMLLAKTDFLSDIFWWKDFRFWM